VLNDEQFAEELHDRLHEAVSGITPSPSFFGVLRRRHRRRVHARRAIIGAAPVALIAISIPLAFGHRDVSAGRTSNVPAHLVSFHAAPDGTVTATITDPLAAQRQLDAVFRQHGLDISVTVLPVSPSLVGTIVFTDAPITASVQSGDCFPGGGGCWVGLVIPAAFTGPANVSIGRAARPGEVYDSAANAFGPGEALHCSGILNEHVSAALPVLQARGLRVDWREDVITQTGPGGSTGYGSDLTAPPSGDYVVNALPISSTTVMVSVAMQPNTSEPQFVQDVNQGC
jgi:hypothetical protein